MRRETAISQGLLYNVFKDKHEIEVKPPPVKEGKRDSHKKCEGLSNRDCTNTLYQQKDVDSTGQLARKTNSKNMPANFLQ